MNFATAGPAQTSPDAASRVPTAIVINDSTHGLVLKRPTSVERGLARLRAGSLDPQLAAGIPPETGTLLALRAYTIVQPATRSRFARSLQHLVRHAAAPRSDRPVALSLPLCRNVRNAANLLNLLIDRLRSPCPVSAQGMAMVKILLTDGAGPLYYPTQDDELPVRVHATLSALQ